MLRVAAAVSEVAAPEFDGRRNCQIAIVLPLLDVRYATIGQTQHGGGTVAVE